MLCPECDHELDEHADGGCTVEDCDCDHTESDVRAAVAAEIGVDESDLEELDDSEVEDLR